MANVTSLFFAAALVFGSVAAAEAIPAQITPAPAAQSSVIAVALCGPGTHLGPHGHYCWPNGASVPAGWTKACPPGYHLGPKGDRCWPG